MNCFGSLEVKPRLISNAGDLVFSQVFSGVGYRYLTALTRVFELVVIPYGSDEIPSVRFKDFYYLS